MPRYTFDEDSLIIKAGEVNIPCPNAALFRQFYLGIRNLVAQADKNTALIELLMDDRFYEGVLDLLKGYGISQDDLSKLTVSDIQNLLFSCPTVGQGQGLIFSQNFFIPSWNL